MSDQLPDRLSVDPRSPYYDAEVLTRDVGVRFKGVEKTNVEEYCVSEGWVRVPVGSARDRHGNPVTIKLTGPVGTLFPRSGAERSPWPLSSRLSTISSSTSATSRFPRRGTSACWGWSARTSTPAPARRRRVAVGFGAQKINLRPLSADKVEWFTADHEAAGSEDLCFLTTMTPDDVVRHLTACGVAIEVGPVAKQGARGVLALGLLPRSRRQPDRDLILRKMK